MTPSNHDQIPEAALAWIRAGKGAALATVVETWGSAPRPPGAQLAISSDSELTGSVSGGCVESSVVSNALEALEDGRPRILDYGVTDDQAFAVGLACGGQIRILVEPIATGQGPSLEVLQRLVEARAERIPTVYAVNLKTWERGLMKSGAGHLREEAAAALLSDKSGFAGDWFLTVHNPPLRLAIVGAVHIAQALAPMARSAGYDVAVIDPRAAFLTGERFPETALSEDWPDEALNAFGLDTRTAVVTLTHDPKIDDPAILTSLSKPLFYLGCLGSRRTHAQRLDRLRGAGVPEGELARIHAPVGADIGAKSPAEIAVSILAQMTERLRRPETRP